MPAPVTLALDAETAAITPITWNSTPVLRRSLGSDSVRVWRILGPIIGSVILAVLSLCAFLYARRLRGRRKRLTIAAKRWERRELLTEDLRAPTPLTPNRPAHANSDDREWQWAVMPRTPPVTSPLRPESLPAQVWSPQSLSFPPRAAVHHARGRSVTTIVLEYRPPKALIEAEVLAATLPSSSPPNYLSRTRSSF